MPVRDVLITHIEARRNAKREEKFRNVRIDNNSSVTHISERNNEEAVIEFRYTANYGGIGTILLEGSMLYSGDITDLMKTWADSGNMPDNMASEIHTAIMSTCVPEAVIISRDIKLPPPLPLPQIKVNKPKKGAKQSSGMEVA